MIRIYNTLSRKKEEFRPVLPGKVGMYVCGPTVYDVPHIGHARSAYIFDVIRRYFDHCGYDVIFVRNVTDVDDKIIGKALGELEGLGGQITAARLRDRAREVSDRYLKEYHRQMDMIGIRHPDKEPKATENIDRMIAFIGTLVEKGNAYVSGGNVYFSVQSFSGYGKLSNRDIGQMVHGVRITPDENKKHPLDFALWKTAGDNEPSWDSPWGKGRPGWHIECSVMSTSILGGRFDIHGGGLDLIFPHHENEIAQAECGTGEPFANYWIHNGLLTVEGEKMSKSLGNYITLEECLRAHPDPDVLKIAFLNSHYRSPMDYSDAKMEESARAKERILIFFDKVDRLISEHGSSAEDADDPSVIESVARAQSEIGGLREKFEEYMSDDFNTPAVMAVIFDAVKAGNDHLSRADMSSPGDLEVLNAIKNYILLLAHILGLSLRPVKTDAGETAEIEDLVRKREEARSGKDYEGADRIREDLAKRGVVVEDTPEGPVWRKK